MATELRKTGISRVGDVPWGTHLCHFYETREDLLDILLPYFKAGLENNEFCLWAVFDPLNAEAAETALREAIPGVDRHLAAGDIEIVAHSEWYLKEGAFDLQVAINNLQEKLAEALIRGYDGIRVNGNEAWLTERDWQDFVTYEEELGELMANQPMIAVCTYPLVKIKATELFDVARSHQFALARRRGSWELLETPGLKQTKAEIKRLNEALEQRVLERTGELAATNEELRAEIAERQRIEESLRASEAGYRAIVEDQTEFICRFSPDGRYTFVNKAYCDFIGWQRNDLLGRSLMQFAPPENRAKLTAHFTSLNRANPVSTREDRNVLRNGEIRWLRWTNRAIFDGQGRVVEFQSVGRDITERKKAEEALRQSEARYRGLFEHMVEGFAYCQMIFKDGEAQDFIYLAVNDMFETLTGLKDVVGKRVTEVIPNIRETDAELFDIYARVSLTGEPEKFEMFVEALQMWFSISAYSPEREYFVAVFDVITERKHLEEESRLKGELLRMTGEMAKIGGWEFDAQTLKGTWTDEVAHIHDLDPDQPTNVELGLSFYRPGSQEKIDRAIKEAIELAKPYDLELEMVSAKGHHKWVRTMGLPITAGGKTVKVRGIFQDITQNKQLEEERTDLEKQLHQAQKMEAVGQLTAGIAHDFNNLIMAINGNAELMQMKIRPEDPVYAMTDTILQAGWRAANLIRQLLIFSRKQIMVPQIVKLNTTITEMNRLLERIIGENIEVTLNLASDLWPVKVDPAQIEQVVVNLVVNARDAMPDGGKLILKTANAVLDKAYAAKHLEVQPGEYTLLTVSDTGIGMSREVQDRLFEPFFTTKGTGKGTGLGLSTVYGIIKQSGGHIWVYSEVGQGSTFKIYLPRTVEESRTASHALPTEEVARGRETILVVEDDAVIREVARDFLKRQGYSMLEAEDGEQALQVAARHPDSIDLLLTDVIMPGMSGKALAEELVKRYPSLKVIYMSGYSDEVISHHNVLEPGVTLLQKPFKFMEMVRKVQEVLG